jgi:hypothetical protein
MTSNMLFYHSTLSLYVIAKSMDGVFWLHRADGEHDDDICGYVIDDSTTVMIADTEQHPELNVQIISSAANDDYDDA